MQTPLEQFTKLQNKVNDKINQYCNKHATEQALQSSWAQFLGDSPYAPTIDQLELPETQRMFITWRNFHWHSYEPLANNHKRDYDLNNPAKLWLSRHPVSLEEKAFIEAAINSYYSFYRVIAVNEHQSMVLKDLLTGQKVEILERSAASLESIGNVLLTAIVKCQNHHFALGMAEFMFSQFPDSNVSDFECEVDMFEDDEDGMLLYLQEQQTALFDLYWDLRDQIFNPVDETL